MHEFVGPYGSYQSVSFIDQILEECRLKGWMFTSGPVPEQLITTELIGASCYSIHCFLQTCIPEIRIAEITEHMCQSL